MPVFNEVWNIGKLAGFITHKVKVGHSFQNIVDELNPSWSLVQHEPSRIELAGKIQCLVAMGQY
jgi:hypothetical protein